MIIITHPIEECVCQCVWTGSGGNWRVCPGDSRLHRHLVRIAMSCGAS